MKKLQVILLLIVGLTFNFMGGAVLGAIAFGEPLIGGAVTFAAGMMPQANSGMLMAGVYKELWTGEMFKMFRLDASWMSTIKSRDDLVNNNTIHMVDVGADPEVLINNTTYPIDINDRTDDDVPIGLDKFDTTNTSVSQDELYAISYDKFGSVVEQHKEALMDVKVTKAAHSIAPDKDTADTPLVMTTGASNGAVEPRQRMTQKDLVAAKKRLDDLNVPQSDRVLVLCNDHIEDLLMIDETFAKQYKDIASGTILNIFGFKIYQFTKNPMYSVQTGKMKKNPWGTVADAKVDQAASFFFYAPRAFQCTGTLDMFYSDAKTDPIYRRSVVGFRNYHICMPKKVTGFGAIVSTIFVPES